MLKINEISEREYKGPVGGITLLMRKVGNFQALIRNEDTRDVTLSTNNIKKGKYVQTTENRTPEL